MEQLNNALYRKDILYMEIIAHRGFWKEMNERNTMTALKRAADSGIGTETDFRDYMERLAVSHNVADANSPLA